MKQLLLSILIIIALISCNKNNDTDDILDAIADEEVPAVVREVVAKTTPDPNISQAIETINGADVVIGELHLYEFTAEFTQLGKIDIKFYELHNSVHTPGIMIVEVTVPDLENYGPIFTTKEVQERRYTDYFSNKSANIRFLVNDGLEQGHKIFNVEHDMYWYVFNIAESEIKKYREDL